jgi:TATA-binding protein-associated factor
MGLGKTLQASAIVASDIAEHQEAYMSDSEAKLLPSLIICPSTLVGHWVFEIEKFIPTSIINPLQYVGTPQDRIQLQSQIDNYNLIVTSYDVLRKDVDFLSKFVWNFCILDEGHIIKNSKSKLTLAVKQLRAEHRLILSGTPIQVCFLELFEFYVSK